MAKSGAKGRKGRIGKKKGQMLKYANERRHEKSHIRRITKHIKRYGETDKTAVEALKIYKARAGVY